MIVELFTIKVSNQLQIRTHRWSKTRIHLNTLTRATKLIHKNRTVQAWMERCRPRSRQLGLSTNLPLGKLRVASQIETARSTTTPRTTTLSWHKTRKTPTNCRRKIQTEIIEARSMAKSRLRFPLHKPKKLRRPRCQCHLRPKSPLVTNYQYRARTDLMAVAAKKLQRRLLTNRSLAAPTRSAS